MPGKPHHARNDSPEMETVANESELVGRREIGAVGDRGMHCIDRHRHLRRRRPLFLSMIFSENRYPLCTNVALRVRIMLQISRADPWWMAPRPQRADRSRPPSAVP